MSNQTPDEIWKKILSEFEEEGQKDDPFLTQVEPVALSDDTLKVSVPSSFTRARVEERYGEQINDLIKKLVDDSVSIEFIITEPVDNEISVRRRRNSSKLDTDDIHESSLNPKYTFDNFVVGRSNQLAHAASIAVTESPGNVYNPLFIYGGVGLGKTHLLHAIGNRVKEKHPELKVLYVSAETFTNDMIDSIKNVYLSSASTTDFRAKYRTIDVLLIDDIQFLQRKESTQEEFFHTFNELHQNSKHIVLTSDKHPKNMPTLEERLRSRFEWGMVTDLVPPELETRIAILEKKCEEQGFGELPDDVILFIAESIQDNIRELEGALIRVVGTADILKTELTVELAKEMLKDTITPPEREKRRRKVITIKDIQKETADYFGISVDDLKSSKRTKVIAFPRQIAMYLIRQMLGSSYTEIGDAFGGRHHTTVMHACSQIEEGIQKDRDLEYDIDNLSSNLKN